MVTTELPSNAAGHVTIVDDGRGMTLDRITDAVSAGFSGD
jgi:hypothetical protein